MFKRAVSFFIFVMLILAGTTLAQEMPDSLWTATYGGDDADHCYDVIAIPNGDIVFAGRTASTGAGATEMWLVKLDYLGNIIWEYTFGGPLDETCYSVQQTTDGGYIMGGFTDSYAQALFDFYLVKVDENGAEEWYQTYPSDASEKIREIDVAPDGGFILAGDTYTSDQTGNDIRIIKTDADGEVEWSHIYGGDNDDYVGGVLALEDGGYVIAGSQYFDGNSFDVYLWRLDEDGEVVWQEYFGEEMEEKCYDLEETADGDFALAGYTYGYGAEYRDFYLIKTNSNGGHIFSRHFGGPSYDECHGIRTTSDGGFLMAGGTQSYGAGDWDAYIVKTNSSGFAQWETTYGGAEVDFAYSMDETWDIGYIIGGHTQSFGAGSSDAFIIRLESEDRIPADFSLLTPENASSWIYEDPYSIDFAWQSSSDLNPTDTLRYRLTIDLDWADVTDTTLVYGFFEQQDTTLTVNLFDTLGLTGWPPYQPQRRVDWWVEVFSGPDTVMCVEQFFFNLNSEDPGAPEAFSLLSPANDDTSFTGDVTLTWQSTEDTDSDDPVDYIVWWATNNTFTEDVDSATVTDTTYTLQGLPDDSQWYWQVRAQDDNSHGTWSEQVFRFRVHIPESPSAFNLLTPVSGDTVRRPYATLTWEASTDPDSGETVTYVVWYASDPSFTTGLDSLDAGDITFVILDDLISGEVYWKVRARDRYTTGTWSNQTNNFTVYLPVLFGSVFDEDGVALSGGSATLIDQNGNETSSIPDNNGEFEFFNLPTGSYTLLVQSPGFPDFRRNGLDLETGYPLEFEVVMYPLAIHDIPVPANRFAMIGFNFTALDSNASAIFESMNSMVLAYDDNGAMFKPPVINSLGTITPVEGYRVFSIEADTIRVQGVRVHADNMQIQLAQDVWNFLPYPHAVATTVEYSLDEIANHVIMMLDDEGGMWKPDEAINTIDSLRPGNSYMILIDVETDFVYPSPDDQPTSMKMPAPTRAKTNPSLITGLPWPLLIAMDSDLLSHDPAQISLYDGTRLVGTANVDPALSRQPVVAWQEASEMNLSGFTPGDDIDVVIYNSAGNVISSHVEESSGTFGSGYYGEIILGFDAPMPLTYEVGTAYPNPFNSTVSLNFALPGDGQVTIAVFSVEGREIFRTGRYYRAGYHRFTWDTHMAGELGSGMYFIQVRHGNTTTTRRVVLVK